MAAFRLARVLVCSCALLAGCVEDASRAWETQARSIIGGVPSTPADHPATGVILGTAEMGGQRGGGMICTGTLIAPDVVLTAAHCVKFGEFVGAEVSYYFTLELDVSGFGAPSLDLPADAILASRVVAHPSHSLASDGEGLGNNYDIGLMFLERGNYNVDHAVIVEPDDSPAIIVGATVEIAGYGQRSISGQEGGVKYHAETIINETAPAEMQIGDRAPIPQKCHGDSGGPTYLAIDDGKEPTLRVIGVTSGAYDSSDCARGGVDTRVDFFRQWVSDEMVAACTSAIRIACETGGEPSLAGTSQPRPDAGVDAPDANVDLPDAADTSDAGVETPDASIAAATDAGGEIDPPDPAIECHEGCSTTRGSRGPGASFLVMLAAVALEIRRRRRR